ncbi:MAG: cytochrome-c peroxidase [Saprospiraceae bacterium]|nr:cytochrome-c peroxidase [Saprospiraceae bacterium]
MNQISRKFPALLLVFVCFQCNLDLNSGIPAYYNPSPYDLSLSASFPEIPIPADNPLTNEGVTLGRMLFFDPILSRDSTQSCGSCHMQRFAFSDSLKFSLGIQKMKGSRNGMPIFNCAWSENLFWDGRSLGLENQALAPVENPIEMHESWRNAVRKLERSDLYPQLFSAAFGKEGIDKYLVAKALAQFERTLISEDSKYDRALRDEETFTKQELRGLNLFFTEKADCFHCHGNILFTDLTFHNIGLDSVSTDYGLENYSGRRRDRGKFKTPTLRNLLFTAPYMHDGRFSTLEEVVDFYSEGVERSPTIDPLMKNVARGGVHLTVREKKDLIAFLLTLTDSTFIIDPKFSNPFLQEKGD